MKRRISRSLVAMALAAMMLQVAPAMADPPAHSQGWKKGRGHAEQQHRDDRGYGWRGGDEHYDDRRDYDRRYDDRRYDDRRDYDRRHYEERYYPSRGYVVPRLPHSHRVVHYHGDRYYYGDGAWYRPYGPNFMVVAPPIGLVVSFLPEVQATLFFGGIPYYQAGPVYYARRPGYGGYVVAQPPW